MIPPGDQLASARAALSGPMKSGGGGKQKALGEDGVPSNRWRACE